MGVGGWRVSILAASASVVATGVASEIAWLPTPATWCVTTGMVAPASIGFPATTSRASTDQVPALGTVTWAAKKPGMGGVPKLSPRDGLQISQLAEKGPRVGEC